MIPWIWSWMLDTICWMSWASTNITMLLLVQESKLLLMTTPLDCSLVWKSIINLTNKWLENRFKPWVEWTQAWLGNNASKRTPLTLIAQLKDMLIRVSQLLSRTHLVCLTVNSELQCLMVIITWVYLCHFYRISSLQMPLSYVTMI